MCWPNGKWRLRTTDALPEHRSPTKSYQSAKPAVFVRTRACEPNQGQDRQVGRAVATGGRFVEWWQEGLVRAVTDARCASAVQYMDTYNYVVY